MDGTVTDKQVLDALRVVMDPELGVNVVDLGLVEALSIEGTSVSVSLGMTSPACPVTPLICRNAKDALLKIQGIENAEVRVAENFHWSAERMSPFARMILGTTPKIKTEVGTPAAERSISDPATAEPTVIIQQSGEKTAWHRLPFLAFAMICLVCGLWAGLVRLGWEWPLARWYWLMVHGPMMVGGFLGTVIGLERAVGLGKKWATLAPLTAAVAAASFLAVESQPFSAALLSGSSFLLTIIFISILQNHRDLATLTMTLGAVCWLIGNLVWFANSVVFLAVPWWIAFLVLTIAGERVELNRFLEPTPVVLVSFVGCMAIILVGCAVSIQNYDLGSRILAAGLMAIAIWLWIYDIARRTVKQKGLTRFTAVCLLVGYIWLLFSGIVGIVYGSQGVGVVYDAFLHSVFIGFVFSMIFGHAPIIFPSVLNRPLNYRKGFYVHLVLLHLGLLLRVIGDFGGGWDLRLWGGLISAIAVALFVFNTAHSILFSAKETLTTTS
ncbi:MAG: metal-sulfur cluster assembly factor [SAR324 cluster bacterium]|nr:metal-sulfur cluster assembly factor [SAR324 cluster bacterium]